jgi:L-ascorbate metabolism protein UlaG (beta-lactamase superfamily)
MNGRSLNRATKAAPRPWHHLPDGTFRNPRGSPARSATWRDYGPFFLRMFGKSLERIEVPAGHALSQDEALAAYRRAGNAGDDTLTWLGHAAFLVRTGGLTIITDPYLTDYAGPQGFGPRRYVKSGIAIGDLPPIDVLLISHNHYDHLDERTIEQLPGKDRMVVLAPLRLGDFFRDRGYANVHDLDWHDTFDIGGVRFTALPAVHWSRRTSFDVNRTLWLGFAIRSATRNLYFGGDSGYGPVFREIGEAYGPFDTALIGIGAYAPRALMQATHTSPEEAIELAADIGAECVVGMHWGTVVLTEEPQFEAPERFRKAAAARGFADEQVWVMRIGETRALPAQAGAGNRAGG